MARHKGKRTQGQRGLMVYIPAEYLYRAGFTRDDPTPYYRVWNGRDRTLFVRLYKEG